MSEISDAIQLKCLSFGDRVIKLNDYLLSQAASRTSDGRGKKYDEKGGKSALRHPTSSLRHLKERPVPCHPCSKEFRIFLCAQQKLMENLW